MIGYLKGPKQYPGRRTQLDTVIESKQPLQPVAQQPRHVHTITDRFSMANTYLIQDARFILFEPYYERQSQLVDIWLDDVEGLPNHLDWRVIASPGLTPESLCLYNPFSYELLCGDTLITIEGGTILVRGGTNRIQLQQTLQTLQSLKVYYLYPGHGRPILSMRALATIEW